SVLVIFFLLYMTLRAALPALVVLLDVPFATVGGVFARYLTGTEMSVSSAVGFITLFGVSVMNGRPDRQLHAARARQPDGDARDDPARGGGAAAADPDDRAARVDWPLAGGAV